MKLLCVTESWYVQEAGERLVQAHLNLLASHSDHPVKQQKSASQALSTLEELLLVDWHHSSTLAAQAPSHCLRRPILSYKAAKLRLFLQPDPRQALEELQDVKLSLSVYYPNSHELMKGLMESLHGMSS